MKVEKRTPFDMNALAEAPAEASAAVAVQATAKPSATPRRDEGLGFARHAFLVAGMAAVIWAGALWAFVAGFQTRFGAFDYAPLQIVALLGLSILPAIFMFLAAYALRQGAQLAAETRRARTLADEMVLPAALAADHAGGAADVVRREIERIAASAAAMREELSSLRDIVSAEGHGLSASANQVETSARRLAATIGQERQDLSSLAASLQSQSDAVVETLTRQAQAVTQAADLAEAQLREAEASLTARTADLALASGDAGATALRSAVEIAEHTDRLEAAGQDISQKLLSLRDGLTSERETLSEFAEALRSDQEDLAARMETGAAQLAEASVQARSGAVELSESANVAIETLRTLAATVAEEVQGLTDMARREQSTAEAQAEKAIQQLAEAADHHYDAVEARTAESLARITEAADAARTTTAAHFDAAAEAASAKLEAMSQVAFAVAQQADQTFDARIASARELIEQSSGLVEDAGRRSAERMEAGLETIRGMLGQLDALLGEVEARTAQLTPETEARIEAVRTAVGRGVADLTEAAHKAAEDTKAIDAMFQERVRRNYEVLNEAVQLIGRVAGGVKPAEPAMPAPPRAPVKSEIRVEPEAAPPKLPELRKAAAPLPPVDTAADAGLRPKLRLAPTPDDRAVKNVFASSNRNGGAERDDAGETIGDEWTWKDLLSSIEEQPVDDETLDIQLIGEIEALGLDIGALLPRARIEEIAVVLHAGDAAAAREVVRRLAPAAVRRLSRRVLTDKVLRAHADRYVSRYAGLVNDSSRPGRDRRETAALLGSDSGRTFLLLDAAVGDLH